MKQIILFIMIILMVHQAFAAKYSVENLRIESIAQEADDEEAPFSIRAINKFHKCGGKSSNHFIVHSEYEKVGAARFQLALTAMQNNWPISVSTHGCEGRALVVNKIRLHRP